MVCACFEVRLTIHAPKLVARDKSGVSEKRFYKGLIRKAADRFEAHLARLKKEGK